MEDMGTLQQTQLDTYLQLRVLVLLHGLGELFLVRSRGTSVLAVLGLPSWYLFAVGGRVARSVVCPR